MEFFTQNQIDNNYKNNVISLSGIILNQMTYKKYVLTSTSTQKIYCTQNILNALYYEVLSITYFLYN